MVSADVHCARAYVDVALREEVARVRESSAGGRANTLFAAAAALGSLVAGGALDEERARAELNDAAACVGLAGREVASTIRSGFAAGRRSPRRLEERSPSGRVPGSHSGMRAVAPPAPERRPPPPPAEVRRLWDACRPVADCGRGLACDFLRRREFTPLDLLSLLTDVRELPPCSDGRWPCWWPGWWADVWRVVLPAFDAAGNLASIHGRAVLPREEMARRGLAGQGPDGSWKERKTTWPKGAGAKGLFMGDVYGVALLRRDPDVLREIDGLLVLEGLTDLLRGALTVHAAGVKVAILACANGSFNALALVPLPAGVPVYVATDNDSAGQRYARIVADALFPRRVLPLPLPLQGEPDSCTQGL